MRHSRVVETHRQPRLNLPGAPRCPNAPLSSSASEAGRFLPVSVELLRANVGGLKHDLRPSINVQPVRLIVWLG